MLSVVHFRWLSFSFWVCNVKYLWVRRDIYHSPPPPNPPDDFIIGLIHLFYTAQALIASQEKFQGLIPGFKFDLGFCGYYYDKGSEAEQLGNQKLVENANQFNWFGHMYNHYQPHNLTEKQLVEYMTMNLKFASVSSYLILW